MDDNGQPETVIPLLSMDVNAGQVIPAFVDGGQWSACFGLSWAEMLLRDQALSNRIIRPDGQWIRKVAGTMGVAAGRNEIVAKFLDTRAEWLFMVDTDMGFAPDTVDRLVASAVSNRALVLGALAFALKLDTDMAPAPFHGQRFRIQPTLYTYHQLGNGECGFRSVARYQRDAFQQVSGTGAACLLMHRDALAKVGAEPFTPLAIPGAGGNGTSRMFSEDLSFCVRLAAAGIGVAVDTSVKTTHEKGGIYLDETAYALQQETLIQAAGQQVAREIQTKMRAGVP